MPLGMPTAPQIIGNTKAPKTTAIKQRGPLGVKISGIMSLKVNRLEYYSDSGHAGDMPITSFSHTGTVIKLNKVPIHTMLSKGV